MFPRERLCSICVIAPTRNSANVSALMHLPHEVTVEGTLENLCMCVACGSCDSVDLLFCFLISQHVFGIVELLQLFWMIFLFLLLLRTFCNNTGPNRLGCADAGVIQRKYQASHPRAHHQGERGEARARAPREHVCGFCSFCGCCYCERGYGEGRHI